MRTLQQLLTVGTLALSSLLVGCVSSVLADHPLEGNWVIKVFEKGEDLSLWLIEMKEKDGTLQAKVLDGGLPGFNQAEVKKVRAENNSLHLKFLIRSLELEVVAYAAKDGGAPDTLRGSILIGNQRDMVRMERTKETKIDPAGATRTGAAAKELREIMRVPTNEKKIASFKEFINKYPNEPVTLQAIRGLLGETDVLKPTEIAELAKRAVELAGAYGPEMKRTVFRDAITALLKSEKGSESALEYARQAVKSIPDDSPLQERKEVLSLLARALRKNNQVQEATQIQEEVVRIERKLDEEFEKTNIPFQPKAYKGRKEQSDRVAVLELFTGAQCPPCISADIAFDALLKTYRPKDVILLQYHLHIPGPDPMTNAATSSRGDAYNVNATPTLFINGKRGPAVGGFREHAEEHYQTLQKMVNDLLEEKAGGQVELMARRKGDEIEMAAKVSGMAEAGKKVRLHFILFEDVVRYAGSNKQRLHHHVVRAMPSGKEGMEVKGAGGSYKQTVNLKDLRAELHSYLKEYEETFPVEERPLDLDNLQVVALLQSEDDGEILNAVQVPVMEEK